MNICNKITYQFQIAEHVTAAQGPVNFGLTTEMYQYVNTYIQWISRLMNLDPEKSIFITYPVDNQCSFMTSMLTKQYRIFGAMDQYPKAFQLQG